MNRIVVLISGNGSNLQALIDHVHGVSGSIVAVVSNRRSAHGLTRAKTAGITTEHIPFRPFRDHPHPRRTYDAHLATHVSSHRPDLVVLAGFMRVVTSAFLDPFRGRVINLHPALPGEFDGLNAMERAWAERSEGRSHSGVMVHEVVEAVDAGPVLGTTVVPFPETFDAFQDAMHLAEHTLLVNIVANWTGPRN